MVEILEFIFSDFKHYIGIIILILSICLGLSWVINALLPKNFMNYHIYCIDDDSEDDAD